MFGNRRLMSRGHLAFQCNLSIDGGDLKAFNKARATYSGGILDAKNCTSHRLEPQNAKFHRA